MLREVVRVCPTDRHLLRRKGRLSCSFHPAHPSSSWCTRELDLLSLPVSVRVSERRGRPKSRILMSTPCRAVWSTTGPERMVSPLSTMVMVNPSNHSDHSLSRYPCPRPRTSHPPSVR